MRHSCGVTNMIRHRMPTELLNRVDQLAGETGLSRNAAVNLAVSLGLSTLDAARNGAAEQQKQAEK